MLFRIFLIYKEANPKLNDKLSSEGMVTRSRSLILGDKSHRNRVTTEITNIRLTSLESSLSGERRQTRPIRSLGVPALPSFYKVLQLTLMLQIWLLCNWSKQHCLELLRSITLQYVKPVPTYSCSFLGNNQLQLTENYNIFEIIIVSK